MKTNAALGKWNGAIGARPSLVRLLGIFVAAVFIGSWTPAAFAFHDEGAEVVSGEATFEHADAGTVNVHASDQAIIQYPTFNIAAGEIVRFTLPSPTASVLNRVIGSAPSEIYGDLFSNGTLFLINANGILFGETANVQAASLVASTLDISNTNFLAKNYVFEATGAALVSVTNHGTLGAEDGGYVALLGSEVENTGTITANMGSVVLAAGNKITVNLTEDGMLQAEIDEPVGPMLASASDHPVAIKQTGTIRANGGRVQIAAEAADGIFNSMVNADGIIEADSLGTRSGHIVLASSGDIAVGGKLSAKGGTVDVRSGKDLAIVSKTDTAGETTFEADRDIKVNADVTTDSGNLTFIADHNQDDTGSFTQAAGTTLETTTFGDIVIASSGASTIANVKPAGDLILEASGTSVTYAQLPDATVRIEGSLFIEPEVTLAAANTSYAVGKDWVNLGEFIPGASRVTLDGPEPSYIYGSNTFNDVETTVPGKTVTFEAGTTQTVLGTATFRGEFGNLVLLRSSVPGTQYSFIPSREPIIKFTDIQDASIRGPPAAPLFSRDSGNNVGFDFSLTSPMWAEAKVVSGFASLELVAPGTVYVTASDLAVLEYPSFSIASGETVRFLLPSPTSTVENRVTGTDVSSIDGTLSANGTIRLINPNGVRVSGAISAPGAGVELSGSEVILFDHALIDVSADFGGGTVLLGGDYQGGGTLPKAVLTYVALGAEIRADALVEGDGGRVIVWSDEATYFYGTILARGGPEGGNGGFVEISSHEDLAYGGQVDLSAPAGDFGTLLFDPENIQIVGSSGGNLDGSDSTDASATSLIHSIGSNTSGTISYTDEGAGTPNPFIVYESEIEGTNANIILQARTGITTSGTFGSTQVLIQSGRNLTLQTRNASATDGSTGIDLTGSADGTNLEFKTQGTGTITLSTGTGASPLAAPIAIGKLTTAGGSVTISGTSTVSVGAITTSGAASNQAGGAVTITATGAVTVTGTITTKGGTNTGGTVSIVSGAVSITGGDVTLAAVDTSGGGTQGSNKGGGTAGALTLDATDGTPTITLNGTTYNLAGTNGSGNGNGGSGGSFWAKDPVTLGANVTVTTTAGVTGGTGTNGTPGTITFDSTINGAKTLTLTTATGTAVTLTGTVGGSSALTSLTVTGTSSIPAVTTTGTQSYTGTTTLNGNLSTTNSNVTFNSATSLAASVEVNAGTGTITVASTLAAGANALTLTADEIDLNGGNNSVSGTSTIFLQPASASRSMTIGGTSAALLQLNLLSTEIAALQDGFSSITIGRSDGIGTATINSVTFSDPVTIRMPGASGDITVSGALTTAATNSAITLTAGTGDGGTFTQTAGAGNTIASGSGAITITADSIVLNTSANTITGTGSITLQPATAARPIVIGAAGGATDFALSTAEIAALTNGFSSITIGRADGTGGATISAVVFNDPVTIRSPSGGTITVNGTIEGAGDASVTLDGAGATTVLNAGITTADQNITISDSVVIGDGLSITLTTGAAAAGNILISGAVSGTTGGASESLTVLAGTGTVTFSSTIHGFGGGEDSSGLTTLTITSAGATSFTGNIAITGAFVQTNAATGTTTFSSTVSVGSAVLRGTTLNFNGAWTVTGAFTLAAGTLNANGQNITLSGNWSNSGTFTAGSGTVTLNGAGAQSISGDTTFNNLTITGGGRTITFEAGKTQTITGTLTLQGTTGNLLSLRSSSAGTQWRIDPQGTRSVSFVDVKDSRNINATSISPTNSVDSGNNTNWFGVTISGTVYSDEGTTTLGGVTVAISINGGAASTGAANGSGVFSITIASLSSGDVVTIYIDGAAQDGVTVTITDAATLTGLNIFQDRLIIRHEAAGPVTITTLDTANNNGDTDIDAIYTVSGGALTMASGKELFILTGDTFAPGGTVTAGDIDINGTFTVAANAVNVSGNWDATGGTVTFTTGTVNFTKAAGTQTLTSAGNSFYNLTHSGAGTLQLSDALTVTNNLTNSAGVFDLNGKNWTMTGAAFSNDATIRLFGSETITGLTQDTDSGLWLYLGDGDSAADTFTLKDFGATDYFHLTINTTDANDTIQSGAAKVIAGAFTISSGIYDANTNTTAVTGLTTLSGGEYKASTNTQTLTGGLTISGGTFTGSSGAVSTGNLTLSSGTLTAPSTTLSLLGNWSKTGGTFTHNSGTVTFTKPAGVQTLDSGGATFNNVTHSDGGGTLRLVTSDLTLAGNLINSGGMILEANGRNITLAGNWSNTATFTSGTGTVTFNGAGTQTLASGGSSFYNITHSGTGTLRLVTSALTVTNNFTNSAGTFDLNGQNWTMTGAGFSNDAIVQLIGSETITGLTQDTDSGTWLYVGDGDSAADTFTLKDFGATDYFNLTINTTDANDTIQSGVGGKVIAGAMTVSGGIYDANAFNTTVTGLASIAGGTYLATTVDQTFNGGLSVSSGTFTGSTGLVDINGAFTQSGGTVTAPSQMNVSGNWSKTGGTFTPGAGTVIFDAAAGTQTLNSGGSSFNNLTHSGAGTLQLITNDLTVTGNLSNSAGTLDANSKNITLAGNWSNTATFTSGTGTVTFNGAGTQTLASGGSSFYNITHSGTGTLRLVTSALTVTNNFTNSAGTFDLNGQNWTMTGAAFSNDGTVQLIGSETITGLTQDTNSGTFRYVGNGDGTADTFTLLDFGGTDYFNLVIATTGTADTFQSAAAKSFAGAFTISSGIYDANGNTTTVTGLTTVSGGEYKASTATQTLNGGLTISGGTFTGSSGSVAVADLTLSSGTLTAPSGTMTVSGNWSKTGGTFTPGTGTISFIKAAGTQTLDSGGASFYNVLHPAAGTLQLVTNGLTITNNLTNSDGEFQANGQALDINGNFLLTGGTFTQGTSTVNLAGNLSISSGATFTKATGGQAITFDGTGTITDSNGTKQDLGVVVIGGVAITTRTLSTAVKMTSLTISVGNTCVITGNSLEFSSAAAVINEGTFRLWGGETLTNVTNLDIDSGTVEYVGRNVTETVVIKNFGATDYFNLRINDVNANPATFQLGAALGVAGTFTVSSGTFDANGNTTTVTGLTTISGGTYLASTATQTFNGGLTVSGGTFTGSTGAVDVNGAVSITSGILTAPSGTFTVSGNWSKTGGTFTPGANTVTFDAAAGTQTLNSGGSSFNNVTHSGAGTLQLVTNNLTLTGNLTNSAGTLDANSQNITLAGNWSNTATFTAGSGTVTFNGAGAQSISGDTTFNNLTITGGGRTITFEAGKTQTITGTFTATGASGNLLLLRSSSDGTQWKIDPQGTRVVSFVDVKDSNNINATAITASSSTNSGNNTNWNFAIVISGTVYSDEGTTTLGGVTVAISINGGAASTGAANGSGVFSITIASLSSGDVVTIYIDGAAQDGVTVTITDAATLTGLNIFQDRLIIRHEAAGPVTITTLDTANNNGDTDIDAIYTISGGALTMASGKELFILTGDTFAPGGTVTAGDIDDNGTFTMAANTINISGNWDATGGAFSGTGAGVVNFTQTAVKTITSNGSSFNNVTFGAGTWTGTDTLTINGTTTFNGAATLIGSGSSLIFNGSVSMGANAVTLRDNVIDFLGGANTVSGTSTLTLESLTASVTIGIAGGAGTLQLSSTDINALADGFSLITIGRASDGTGTVIIGGNVTFKDNVTIVGGSIESSGTLTSGGNTVTLTARTGNIIDGNGATTNVSSSTLNLNAVTGIGSADALETSVATLAVTNTTSGNIQINETDGFSVSGSNTGGGTIVFTAGAGVSDALTVNAGNLSSNGGDITLAANNITLTGTVNSGAGRTTLQARDFRAIDLGGADGTTTLGLTSAEINKVTAGIFTIGDPNAGAITISAAIAPTGTSVLTLLTNGAVSQTAGSTITVASLRIGSPNTGSVTLNEANDVDTLAGATADGGASFSFKDADGFTVGTVDGLTGIVTTDGAISLTSTAGNLTASAAVTAGGTGRNITLSTTTSGNILVGSVTASGDDVTLTSTEAITESGSDAAADITAATATLTAQTGIGFAGTIEIDLTTLTSASTTLAGGDIDLSDTAGGLTVTSATTTNGSITLGATGGNLILTTVTAGGSNRNIFGTTTTSGDILVGDVTAAGDTVNLTSAGAIEESGSDAGADITAGVVSLTAATGIGAAATLEIDTTAASLTANVTGTGPIVVTDTAGDFGVASATTNDGLITLIAAAGNLSVATVTAGGTGRNVTLTASGSLTTGTVSAAGDTVTLNAGQGGGGSTNTISSISGGTININGGAGDDSFNVSAFTGTATLDAAGGTGDSVTLSKDAASFTLSDTSLTATGGPTLTLANVEVATLTGGASANSFTVTGWTGTATLTGAAGSDTLALTQDTSFTLTDASLTRTSGGTFTLSGIEVANLTGGASANSFTVTGWTGTGTLTGAGGTDTVIASNDVDFTLTDASLARTGLGTLTLATIEDATLTGGASANTFTLTGWTGTATLTGAGGSDTLVLTQDTNFVLTNLSLTRTSGGTLTLATIEVANLTGGASANSFTVSDWTGTGTLTGAGGTDTLALTQDASFILTDSSLTRGGFGTLTLATLENVSLTGGSGANTFNVTGWTGTGTFDGAGGTDTVAASNDVDFTLTDASLARTGLGTLTLANVEGATLTGGASANSFTLTGWTGTATLTGAGGTDTLVLTQDTSFTLADASLTRTSGGALTLATIEVANLTGGAGANTFTVTSWTGTGTLTGAGGTDTVIASNDVDFTLADASLARSGLGTLTLATIEDATLTGGASANSFTLTGWTGTATLTGAAGSDTLVLTQDTDFTLTDASLTRASGGALTLSGIEVATLTGGASANSFTVSGWTGTGTLTGAGGTDTVIASNDVGFTLADASLARSGLGTLTLATIEAATLTGGASANTFTLTGWTGTATLTGAAGSDTLVLSQDTDFTLADASLTRASGGTLTLSGIEVANLTGGASANSFTVTGWSGTGTLTGAGGSDTLNATNDLNFTLTDTSLARTGLGTLTLATIEVANLTGGASANIFDISDWSGTGTIDGQGGTDTIIASTVFNITGTNAGNVDSLVNFLVESLTGGGAADSFNFSNGASVSGSINGLGGNDTLNYSAYTSAVFVNLPVGGATGIGGTFSNIESATGGSATADTLTGPNGANTWSITANNAGTVGTFTFSSFESLNGGTSSDSFLFTAGVGVSGAINGGGGTDTLNYAAYTTNVTVNLATGTATNVTVGVSNFENVIGGSGDDTLTGDGGVNELTGNGGNDTLTGGAGADTLSGGADTDTVVESRDANMVLTNTTLAIGAEGTDTLSGIENVTLTGGASANILTLTGWTGGGTVNGGAGSDTLIGGGTFTVTSANGGTLGAVTFSNVENLTGGAGNDTFTLNGGTLSGAINGGVGTDTLTGDNVANTWNITSNNAGTVTGVTGGFTSIENLVGGTGSDNFVFSNGVGVTGTVNGGTGANTFDHSAYTTAVSVNLAAGTATGTGGFSNIIGFTGGAASDTFIGANAANTWNITANNAGNIGGVTTFTSFENLTGGSANDTFKFSNGVGVAGTLTGSGGTDTMDYSAYATAISFNLQTGAATGTGGFTGIESLIGGASGNDTLTGTNADSTWSLTANNAGDIGGTFTFTGIENLNGGAGNDTFKFSNLVTFSGVLDAGAGTADTLDYTLFPTATVNLGTKTASNVFGGAPNGILNFESVIGFAPQPTPTPPTPTQPSGDAPKVTTTAEMAGTNPTAAFEYKMIYEHAIEELLPGLKLEPGGAPEEGEPRKRLQA